MAEDRIHIELFSSPDAPKVARGSKEAKAQVVSGPQSQVSIRLDGATMELKLAYDGESVLDAALRAGADLPYACKGGVCSTCRAMVTEGKVEMEVNYALEPQELARGFVLTCQSHPRTERVVVDFDAR